LTASSIEALPEPLLRRVAAQALTRTFPKNAVIVTEGDESDSLYILLAGRAKVYVSGEGDREFYLNQLKPGEYFGEVRLDGGPRSASVIALEECRCAILKGADLLNDVGPRHLLGLANVAREVVLSPHDQSGNTEFTAIAETNRGWPKAAGSASARRSSCNRVSANISGR